MLTKKFSALRDKSNIKQEKPIASKRKIYTYNIMRSVSSFLLFNVVGLGQDGELMAVIEVDLEFDDAVELQDKLKNELDIQDKLI